MAAAGRQRCSGPGHLSLLRVVCVLVLQTEIKGLVVSGYWISAASLVNAPHLFIMLIAQQFDLLFVIEQNECLESNLESSQC